MDEQQRRINERVLRELPNNGGKAERRAVLESNAQLRKEGTLRGLPGEQWGYVALSIPVDDMRVIQLRYPDVCSLDPQIQHAAWQKFIRSPESEPYKVRKNDGKRGLLRRGVIVN
jgi:hypothetical protein